MLRLMLALALIGLVGVLWLPLLSELLSLLARGRARPGVDQILQQMPRLLFLVPAHDEERMVAACARSLVQMQYPASRRRIIVIADNCSDATARLAREQGA